uniref:Epoxide hydrolase n=1 Tax=Macrostomum lignano TaxID=282301 RepID=A0A1I8HIM3_9PLAT
YCERCSALARCSCWRCCCWQVWAFLDRLAVPPKPDLPATLNWGSSATGGGDSEAVKPMKVSVSDTDLNSLKSRLRAFKFVEPLENSAFEYGFNGRFMQQVVTYWLEKYDWRQWEKKINSFENYLTRIEGLQVHFMHVKPKKAKKRAPLLLLHGWPGSVIEFHKLLPLLTTSDSDGFAFEVVAASLPGFAGRRLRKSEASTRPPLLGLWGSIVGHVMAIEFQDRLLGFHTSMPMQSFRHPSILLQMVAGSFLPAGVLFDKRDCDKIYPFFGKLGDLMRESGYFHLQATRPDSVGHALSDSPVGLAAYILEKFSVATNLQNRFSKNGNLVGPKAAFTLDELLTNVMIYWTTGSITSSMRFYKEDISSMTSSIYPSIPRRCPMESCRFLMRFFGIPERFVRILMTSAATFAALELPELVAKDIRKFFLLAEAFHSAAAKRGKKSEL